MKAVLATINMVKKFIDSYWVWIFAAIVLSAVAYIMDEQPVREVDKEITRAQSGNLARYVDHKYGVICYNGSGTYCIAAPDVKQ